MDQMPSLEKFEEILEKTIYQNREKWIWRIHLFQNTTFLLLYSKRSICNDQGETFPPSLIWMGSKPVNVES